MIGGSRAPYGARGLKFIIHAVHYEVTVSRPVWGAWIEIPLNGFADSEPSGRAPYGARGLKFIYSVRVFSSRVAPRMGRVD